LFYRWAARQLPGLVQQIKICNDVSVVINPAHLSCDARSVFTILKMKMSGDVT